MHILVYILTVHHTSRFRNDYAWDCVDFDFSEITTHTVSNVTCMLHLSFKLNKKRKRKNQHEPHGQSQIEV